MKAKRLAALLIVLAILFSPGSVVVQGKQPSTGTKPLDIILLLDSSPSTRTTDPNNLRISAARFLLDYLEATSQVLGVNYRAGVVNFGARIGETVPLRPLQGGVVRDALVAEEIPYTDFRPALDFALKEFRSRSFGTNNIMAVILFTDGNPQLTANPLSVQDKVHYFRGEKIEGDEIAYRMDQLVSDMQDSNVTLFVVAVGDAGQDAELWQTLVPPKHYRSIDTTTNLADMYHDFVTDIIGGIAAQAQTLLAGESVEVLLPPYLEYTLFSFLKDGSGVTITLMDPNGETYRPTLGGGPEELYEIYLDKAPQEGIWQVSVANGGAQMWLDQRLPTLAVEVPEVTQVLGQPVMVYASLLHHQKPVVDPRLNLQARIEVPPTGQVRTEPLTRVDDGRYAVALTDLSEPGTYTVTVIASIDGRPLATQSRPALFRVFPVPTIETFSVEGELVVGSPITLTAHIRHADRLLLDMPVLVQVLNRAGREMLQIRLRDDGMPPDLAEGDGEYVGEIEWTKANESGRLVAVVSGTSRDGLPFASRHGWVLRQITSTPMPTVTVSPTPIPTATYSPTPTVTPMPPTATTTPTITGVSMKPPGGTINIPWRGLGLVLALGAVVVPLGLGVKWTSSHFGIRLLPPLRRAQPASTVEDNLSHIVISNHRYQLMAAVCNLVRGLPLVGNPLAYRLKAWIDKFEGDRNEALRYLLETPDSLLDPLLDNRSACTLCENILRISRANLDRWWELQRMLTAGPRHQLRRVATQNFNECIESHTSCSPFDLLAEATRHGTIWTYREFWESELWEPGIALHQEANHA